MAGKFLNKFKKGMPQTKHKTQVAIYARAGALDKLKQKSVWHVPSGRAHPDVTNRTKLN